MKLYNKVGDELYIIYHYDEDIETGDTLLIWDEREGRGLLAYVISHEFITLEGTLDELIKNELIEHTFKVFEYGEKFSSQLLGDISNMKIAKAKIRMEIKDDKIDFWSGWIPTRDVKIERLGYDKLIEKMDLKSIKKRILIGISPDGDKVYIDGSYLQGINIITGEKGSGKSHLAKTILVDLIKNGGKAVIIDLNNEYSGLRISKDGYRSDLFNKIIVLRPGDIEGGMKFTLDYIGIKVMQYILNKILELPDHSTRIFTSIWNFIQKRGEELTLSKLINLASSKTIVPHEGVRDAIVSRLMILSSMGILTDDYKKSTDLRKLLFEELKGGGALIINLKGLDYQTMLVTVQIIISKLSEILEKVSDAVFLFIEEAQLYIRRTEWLNLVTRVRHLGLFQFYITNTPRSLIPEVIDQADNLFLYRLSDEEDVKYLTPIARMDSRSLRELSSSIPYRRFILFGKASKNYPITVDNIEIPYITAGVTKKIW